MTGATRFSAERVNQLRRRAQRASNVTDRGPEGWSKSDVDPMALLSAFPSLHLKEGLTLRAYQFREGGNGNGVVWAMPVKETGHLGLTCRPRCLRAKQPSLGQCGMDATGAHTPS